MDNTLEQKLKNPEKYIPNGSYCYDGNAVCPFWENKKDAYPQQENGFCHFLGKSDWELNEIRQHEYVLEMTDNVELIGKTVAEVFGPPTEEDIDPVSRKVMHFGLSLLWDQCKECNINDKYDFDI